MSKLPEVRISGLKPQLHSDIVNISENMGITITSMLKPVVQEFVNKQPASMKQPKKD